MIIQNVNFAKAGDSCNIGLNGIEERQLFIGSVLCEEGWAIPIVERFECKVLVLEPPVPILPGMTPQIAYSFAVRFAGLSPMS